MDEKYNEMLLRKGLIPVNVQTAKDIFLRVGEIKGYTHTSAITVPTKLLEDPVVMSAVQKVNAVPVGAVTWRGNAMRLSDPYAFVSTYGTSRIANYQFTNVAVQTLIRMMDATVTEFAALGGEAETIYQSLITDVWFRIYTSMRTPYTVLEFAKSEGNVEEVTEFEDDRNPVKKLSAIVTPILQRYRSVLIIGSAPGGYLRQFPLRQFKVISYDKLMPAFVSNQKTGVRHYNKYFTLDSFPEAGSAEAIIIDAEDVSSREQTPEKRLAMHTWYMQVIKAAESRGFKYYSVKWRPRPGDEEAFASISVPSEGVFLLQAYNGMNSFETRLEGEFPIKSWVQFDVEEYIMGVRRYNNFRKLDTSINATQAEQLMMRLAIHGDYLELASAEKNVLSTFSISNSRNKMERVKKFLNGRSKWCVTYPMRETPNGIVGGDEYTTNADGILTTQVSNGRVYTDMTISDPREFEGVSKEPVRVTTFSELLPFMEGEFPNVSFATRGTYIFSNFSLPMQQLNQGPSSTTAPYVKEYSGSMRSFKMVDSFALYKPRIERASGLAIPSKYYTYIDEDGEFIKTSGHLLNLLLMASYYVIPIERYLRSVMRQHGGFYTFGEETDVNFHTVEEMVEAYKIYEIIMMEQGMARKYSESFVVRNSWVAPLARVHITQEKKEGCIELIDIKSYMTAMSKASEIDYSRKGGVLNIKVTQVIDWMLFDLLVNREVTGNDEIVKNVRSKSL